MAFPLSVTGTCFVMRPSSKATECSSTCQSLLCTMPAHPTLLKNLLQRHRVRVDDVSTSPLPLCRPTAHVLLTNQQYSIHLAVGTPFLRATRAPQASLLAALIPFSPPIHYCFGSSP
jgi:hypothetical protein